MEIIQKNLTKKQSLDPLISIIIPSYNQGQFIKETIDSILTQSYKHVEVIVMDGGSSDSTIAILKSYGEQIFWVSEKDRGQTHAINKGIALAKGEIITYLNSDDYLLSQSLQIVVDAFKSNHNQLWITGNYLIVDENGKQIQSLIANYKKLLRKFLSFNLLSVLNPIIQPGTFMRKELISEVGQFNESLRYTMDYDYWLRAIRIKKPMVLIEKLSAFRIHGSSKGGSQYKKQFEEELNVAKYYQKNKFYILFHHMHNTLIINVYKIIK